MIRTRDFLLFLLSVSFLLIAIIFTATSGTTAPANTTVTLEYEPVERQYDVEVIRAAEPDRESRIASLREQILAQGETEPILDEFMETESEDTAVETVSSSTEPDAINTTEIVRCSNYAPTTVAWPRSDIQTIEREGARVVYVERETPPVGTSSEPVTTEDVLVQLPVRNLPTGEENCLASDVVGIALDGSLIRNTDYTAYQIFEKYTLIGYALDGFPIYGTAPNVETDQCGGAIVGASYRYYLSPEREGVLGCFSGTPVTL